MAHKVHLPRFKGDRAGSPSKVENASIDAPVGVDLLQGQSGQDLVKAKKAKVIEELSSVGKAFIGNLAVLMTKRVGLHLDLSIFKVAYLLSSHTLTTLVVKVKGNVGNCRVALKSLVRVVSVDIEQVCKRHFGLSPIHGSRSSSFW